MKREILLSSVSIMLLFVLIPISNSHGLESDTRYSMESENLTLQFTVNEITGTQIKSGNIDTDKGSEKFDMDSVKVLDTSDNLDKAWFVGNIENSQDQFYVTYIIHPNNEISIGLWILDENLKITKYRNESFIVKVL